MTNHKACKVISPCCNAPTKRLRLKQECRLCTVCNEHVKVEDCILLVDCIARKVFTKRTYKNGTWSEEAML